MNTANEGGSDSALNLYVIGFMGTGKSSISRRVARKLGMQFLDVDDEIERSANLPIPEIFDKHGESYFRQLEWDYIDNGHPGEGCVISCGGGLITQDGMSDLLKSKGVLLCLHASVETILARTQGNSNRPLLNVNNPKERIGKLLADRQSYYNKAHASILTDQRSIPEVVEHVIRNYRTLSHKHV